MLSVKDKGSTRSGRTYLPDYIERILGTRLEEVVTNLRNSNIIDINSIDTLMSKMTISEKPKPIREKTLREYGAPSRHYIGCHGHTLWVPTVTILGSAHYGEGPRRRQP